MDGRESDRLITAGQCAVEASIPSSPLINPAGTGFETCTVRYWRRAAEAQRPWTITRLPGRHAKTSDS